MHNHILVACMPKSASTFVSNALAEAAGLQRASLVPDFGRREQELCEICVTENDELDYVAQQHIKCSSWTEQLCAEHDISAIVLVRSLFDVVISVRDHMHKESTLSPVFFLEPRHLDRSSADLEHMIAMLAIPWYINFYMGWRSSKCGRIFMYEDVVADPDKALGEMLAFAGIAARPERIAAGLKAARGGGSRINVGKAGRGMGLQPKTVSMIMDMLAAYPEIQDDRYVQMMKAQAERILAVQTVENPVEEAIPAVGAPVPAMSFSKRVQRFVQRKSRLFGRKRSLLVALGLIACGGLYYAFLNNLIPNSLMGGRLDDLIVPAVLVFFASRILTRTRFRSVPVPSRRDSASAATPAE